MGVLVPAKKRKIHSKMKVLEWLKVYADFLTPQSEVVSTLNSNSSKFLWLFLLPARMKKIQTKMKALMWSQHYPSTFKMLKGS